MKFSLPLVVGNLLLIVIIIASAHEPCNKIETHKVGEVTFSSEKSERFCKHFFDETTEGKSDSDERGGKHDCLKVVADNYFDKIKESNDSIDQYAESCKKFYDEWYECLDMIHHFNKYCYSMQTAHQFLAPITKEEFADFGGYNGIILKEKLWKELASIKNLNIHKCLQIVFDGLADQSINYMKPHDIILQIYKEWFNKNPQSKCRCVEVIGLYRVYEERTKTNADTDGKMVEDYYKEICLETIENREVWKSSNFIGIAKTSGKTSIQVIKLFLKRCQILAEHWYDENDDSRKITYWPFDYLIDAIDLTDNSVSEERLNLVAYAIKVKISADTFTKFIEITESVEGFKTTQCKYKILSTIFYSKVDKGDVIYPSKCSNERGFNEKFGHLINIFEKSVPVKANEIKCEKFTTLLKEFDDILSKTMWHDPYINEILEQIDNSNISFNVMLQCMTFSVKFEDKVFIQKGQMGGRKLREFRKKLYLKSEVDKICKEEIEEYKLQGEENLNRLLNYVVGET